MVRTTAISETELLGALADATAGHARPAAEDDAVDGVRPRWVASPGGTDEASRVLTIAAENGLRVVPRGSGGKLRWGLPPDGVDLVVDTKRLRTVVDHAAGDLVVVTQSGVRLADLRERLAEADQRLALDEVTEDATVGGAIAASTSGPLRLLYGTVRDLLIGITVVRADGVVSKSGGRVVKNVAGYDLGKLYTGSFGTLGLVTEAVFRLHPRPAARAFVTASVGSAEAAHRCVQEIVHSQLVACAVEVEREGDGPMTVVAAFEGVERGVRQRVDGALRLLGNGATTSDAPPAWWGRLPAARGDVLLKVGVPITALAPVLDVVAARAPEATVRGSAGAGALYVGLDAATDPSTVAALVSALREEASPGGGSVVVLHAPVRVRAALDVWGPVPGLALMRRLKDEFDPDHRLAPGRFVGGI